MWSPTNVFLAPANVAAMPSSEVSSGVSHRRHTRVARRLYIQPKSITDDMKHPSKILLTAKRSQGIVAQC